MQKKARRGVVAAFSAAALLTAGGVWAAGTNGGTNAPPVNEQNLNLQAVAALTPATNCDDLLAHFKDQGKKVVGPYGLDGPPIMPFAMKGAIRSAATAADATAPLASGSAETGSAQAGSADGAVTDSTTNVQVKGVDESDIVKTDGDLMLSIVDGKLEITRMAAGATKTIAEWQPAMATAQSMLVSGTKAIIFGTPNQDGYEKPPTEGTVDPRLPSAAPPWTPTEEITVLDLTNPEKPLIEQKLTVDGTLGGSARLVGNELRFALTSGPVGINWKQPVLNYQASAAKQQKSLVQATSANEKLLEKTTLKNWLPQAFVTNYENGQETAGVPTDQSLVDCANVSIPKIFSGLQTLSMVSLNLATEKPLTTWRTGSVLATDGILYANADHAWLATNQWNAVRAMGTAKVTGFASDMEGRFAPVSGTTQIHLFDTPIGGQPTYQGSGKIQGTLINEFAMDEQNGVLRVASTTDGFSTPVEGPAVEGPADDISADSATEMPVQKSESRITTLKLDDGKLAVVGTLTGLGSGERIQGVRFDGNVAYVVTYLQTDPLFTVDLTDPAAPKLRGELKLPGYSAYLQPVGAGRVLGLGQAGTDSGSVTGLQLSLFDVSNLDSPSRLAQERIAGAWSDAESDHHAFTMTGNLVLVPYSGPDLVTPGPSESVAPDGKMTTNSGVIAIRVEADGFGRPSTLRTSAYPMRVLVHDNDIYTLTDQGVTVHQPTTTGYQKAATARF